jgi:N-acetylglucosaminyl-diphospho-decaprenol L-rhamnosyltransferase
LPAVRFSAVIVTHNSRPDLERLLASVERHLEPQPQLVVVDVGSTDGTTVLAHERAELLELPHNPGFGAATNAGVERAREEVTVLLNPDVELLDGGLGVLAERARGRRALLAPGLLNADGSVQRSAHPAPGTLEALLPALIHPRLLPRPLRLRADPWRSDRPRRVGWAIAACLAAPTGLLRELGPFDPGAFLFYEDMELCLRARAAGVPTELHADVRLRHAGAHSTGPAFGGEPHELLAARRREVVGARLGARALALDDAAQALTLATRAAARSVLRRDASRERAQLAALRRARARRPEP